MNRQTIDTEEVREGLRVDFKETARWRRETAIEYPNDRRNLEAAQSLERLATTVDQIDARLLAVYGEEFDYRDAQTTELRSELLRQIGFSTDYETATDFVQAFINKNLKEDIA